MADRNPAIHLLKTLIMPVLVSRLFNKLHHLFNKIITMFGSNEIMYVELNCMLHHSRKVESLVVYYPWYQLLWFDRNSQGVMKSTCVKYNEN